MRRTKAHGFLSSQHNRAIIIVVEVACLLTLIVVACAVFHGGIITPSAETTRYVTQKQPQTESQNLSFDDFFMDYAVSTEVSASGNGNQVVVAQTQPIYESAEDGPLNYTDDEILRVLTNAIKKTRSYTNNTSVRHKESFDANVTNCTGGSIVKSVAELMIGWVVEPVDETLSYSGGVAVNSEGEMIQMLLPINKEFSLSDDGVSFASIERSGRGYVIDIELVRESVGMYEVPVHNASSIGYLDVSNFDLSFLEVDSADITYKGSGMTFHINSDGYITYAIYKIPLKIEGSGHKGSISGEVTFDGRQTEEWIITYQ